MPAITLVIWIIKILATTFGETAGDFVSMYSLGETTADAPTAFWLDGYALGIMLEAAGFDNERWKVPQSDSGLWMKTNLVRLLR